MKKIKTMRGVISAVVAIALLAGISSCKTSRLVSDNTTTTVTEEVNYRPRTVKFHVPADSIDFNTNIASGVYFIHLNDTTEVPCFTIEEQEHTVSNGDITLRVRLDSLANLSAEALTREKELEQTIMEKERIIKEQTEVIRVYEERETMFAKLMKKIMYGAIGLIVIALVVAAIAKKIIPGF